MEQYKEKEVTDQDLFESYVRDLHLTPEDLGKKILDVGSEFAQFAKYAKENGINDRIFSFDGRDVFEEREKSVQGGMEVGLPFKNESFDLIVSHAAFPYFHLYYPDAILGRELRNNLNELLRVVSVGGEIRFGPVAHITKEIEEKTNKKSSESLLIKQHKAFEENLVAALDEMEKAERVKYEITNIKNDDPKSFFILLVKIKKLK